MFWNFAGLALLVISFGTSWSIIRANQFEVETAQYKLKTTNALVKVQKASDKLANTAEKLPISKTKRIEIKKLTTESNAVFDAAQFEVNQDVERLID